MVIVCFDLGGVDAAVIDDDQIDFRSLFHIDMRQQFLAGNAPIAIAAGQLELFGLIADLGDEFNRSHIGSVKIIQKNGDQMHVVVVRPLSMVASRLKMHHMPTMRTVVMAMVMGVRATGRRGISGSGRSRLFATHGRGANQNQQRNNCNLHRLVSYIR